MRSGWTSQLGVARSRTSPIWRGCRLRRHRWHCQTAPVCPLRPRRPCASPPPSLDYVPHSAGRALRSQRVSAIAVVLPHSSQHVFSHPTLTALLDGIVSVAADNDLSTILSTSRTEEDEASAYRRFMNGREADGVIVASAAVADANVIGLARSGYPIVIVGRAPHLARATAVSLDDCHGGEVATRHLLEAHGVQRIAHISGPLGHQSAQDKLTGTGTLLWHRPSLLTPPWRSRATTPMRAGTRAVEKLVRAGHALSRRYSPPTTRWRWALARRFKPLASASPGTCSWSAMTTYPLARYVEPALTSVQGDMAEVGSVAASRLLELIGGRLARPAGHLVADRTCRPELVRVRLDLWSKHQALCLGKVLREKHKQQPSDKRMKGEPQNEEKSGTIGGGGMHLCQPRRRRSTGSLRRQ